MTGKQICAHENSIKLLEGGAQDGEFTRTCIYLNDFSLPTLPIHAHFHGRFLHNLNIDFGPRTSPFLKECIQSLDQDITEPTALSRHIFGLRQSQSIYDQSQARFCVFVSFIWLHGA